MRVLLLGGNTKRSGNLATVGGTVTCPTAWRRFGNGNNFEFSLHSFEFRKNDEFASGPSSSTN